MSYVCEDKESDSIPGAARPVAPAPLLPNFGYSSIHAYQIDMEVRVELLYAYEL